jgi:hypothetical protein
VSGRSFGLHRAEDCGTILSVKGEVELRFGGWCSRRTGAIIMRSKTLIFDRMTRIYKMELIFDASGWKGRALGKLMYKLLMDNGCVGLCRHLSPFVAFCRVGLGHFRSLGIAALSRFESDRVMSSHIGSAWVT